jgi:hypothetical protein
MTVIGLEGRDCVYASNLLLNSVFRKKLATKSRSLAYY